MSKQARFIQLTGWHNASYNAIHEGAFHSAFRCTNVENRRFELDSRTLLREFEIQGPIIGDRIALVLQSTCPRSKTAHFAESTQLEKNWLFCPPLAALMLQHSTHELPYQKEEWDLFSADHPGQRRRMTCAMG
jgi:hypothetical protein